ncbi:MAG: putative LytR family regulatory protein [Acidimicrobiia bacterium]|nr:putative LytR family regulatory protein [Acidimicrobiia bacterium]
MEDLGWADYLVAEKQRVTKRVPDVSLPTHLTRLRGLSNRRLPTVAAVLLVFAVTAGASAGASRLWVQRRVDGLRHAALKPSLRNPASGTNYLIVGSDSRSGADPNDPDFASIGSESNVGGQRSDTIMVLHVAGSDVRLLSVPRDLFVTIPGFKAKQRINAAYGRSPATLVDTLRTALQIPISHYLEIDFQGFKGLVDALGGVQLCLDQGMGDPTTGFNIPQPGCHVINGVQALQWARSRHMRIFDAKGSHEDPTGDLGRIKRQQQFLRAVADRAVEVTARQPLAVGRVIDALQADVVVDDAMTPAGLLDLMRHLQSAGGGGIQMGTFPATPTVVNGAAVLRPEVTVADPFLQPFR